MGELRTSADFISFVIFLMGIFWAWIFTRRYLKIPSNFIFLVYHPDTGKRILRLIRTMRLILSLGPALLMAPILFHGRFQYRYLSDIEGQYNIETTSAFAVFLTPVFVIIGIAILATLGKYYIRSEFRKFSGDNPQHAKAISGLGELLFNELRIHYTS